MATVNFFFGLKSSLCIITLILSVKMSKRKQFTIDENETGKGNIIRKLALENDIVPTSLQTILKTQDDL